MNDNALLIRRAYDLLDRVTPLTTDCGRLCGGRCCTGDSETGMFLFPGEEELIKHIDRFDILDCEGNFGYKMVVCNGTCDRKTRPLACRIYPYFPVISENGFSVRADIRGISSCPLLSENIRVNYGFIRQIRKVARLLSRDDKIKEYIINMNSMLDEIEDFAKRMK